jgi:pimeloyl-ACP methyl ester carboxylesterase
LIFLVLLPVTLLLAGLVYQAAETARDRRRYPAPGRIVDVSGHKLHILELGYGSPVVVLEAGIGASSLSWVRVQPKIARFTRVVSYDRAGLGWSAGAKAPPTVERMISEFRSLLKSAGVPAPYLLVGHSFGGLLVRAYAALYASEVAGLVLVDPVGITTWADCTPAALRRVQLGARLGKRGARLARVGVVRAALATLVAGRTWFPKLAARTGGKNGTAAMAHLIAEVRKLPSELWPIVRAHWSDPKCFQALSGYLGCLPESARYVRKLLVGDIPTIILSASTATQQELDERDSWVEAAGQGSEHHRVPGSGHWLHLDYPELVVDAIRSLLERKKLPDA